MRDSREPLQDFDVSQEARWADNAELEWQGEDPPVRGADEMCDRLALAAHAQGIKQRLLADRVQEQLSPYVRVAAVDHALGQGQRDLADRLLLAGDAIDLMLDAVAAADRQIRIQRQEKLLVDFAAGPAREPGRRCGGGKLPRRASGGQPRVKIGNSGRHAFLVFANCYTHCASGGSPLRQKSPDPPNARQFRNVLGRELQVERLFEREYERQVADAVPALDGLHRHRVVALLGGDPEQRVEYFA